MAEVIETPVWAALGPLDRDRGIFNMGSVVGMLLVGNDTEEEAGAELSRRTSRSICILAR